jgi:hypothetical protein
MSTPARILLERAVQGGGQLLKVEKLGDGATEGPARALVFTFDVGRILVTAEDGQLRGDTLQSAEDLPSGLLDAAEEEPWWRILGNPVTKVGPDAESGFDVQFRHDDANPRRVRLRVDGSRVSAKLVS